MAGYSGTLLAKKLGAREGCRVRTRGAPADYLRLVSPRPGEVTISTAITREIDIYHLFTESAAELEARLPQMMRAIRPDGMIWVSWPQRSSGVATDVTEDTIRDVALPLGLVELKVGALIGAEPIIYFRRLRQIGRIVNRAPFGDLAARSAVKPYVLFLMKWPRGRRRLPLRSRRERLELLTLHGNEAYVVGRRKKNGFYRFPNNFVEAELGVPATSRNWSPVTRIAGLRT